MTFQEYLDDFNRIISGDHDSTIAPLKEMEFKAKNDNELNYRQRDAIMSRCLNFRMKNWAKPARKTV